MRPRRPRRRTLIDWSAAALVAAALYATPSFVVGVSVSGSLSTALGTAAAVAVLVVYALRTGSALAVLGLLVLLAVVEYAAAFGSAMGERCGHSAAAADVETAGAIVLLVSLGALGIRTRHLYLVPLAVIVAAIYVVAIAHLIPGGAGGCFE